MAPGDNDIDPTVTDTGADAGAADDATDPGADDAGGAGATVLCTILDNGDGTFQLVQGDEPESGDGGDDTAMSGEASEGMPPAAGGVAASPQGQSFDSPGPLLKAVLDLLKAAEEKSGGGAEANFQAGYSGGKPAAS